MSEKLHICQKCKSQMFQKFNSSIFVCFECEKKAKSVKSKPSIAKKVTVQKTGLKRGKTEKQKARDRADQWFSRYIRLKNAMDYGGTIVTKCYTCNKTYKVKDLDCGHYINREHISVRFNENNARPQCTYCNCYRSGKHFDFGVKLAKEIGAEEFDNLRQMALFTDNNNELYFREQAEFYRKKVNEIIKEKNIINPWK